MLKPPILLVSFCFLFLKTLHAAPSGRSAFNHLPTTPPDFERRSTQNQRRRSSLCPRQEPGTILPVESQSQLEEGKESSSAELSRPDNSFDAQLKEHDKAITAASNEFHELAKQIETRQACVNTAFINDLSDRLSNDISAIEADEDSSSFHQIREEVTAGVFSSPSPNSSFRFEDYEQNDPSCLFKSLTDAKTTVVANTYYYTTDLLEKIVSFETEDPNKACEHWAELVGKTKKLTELLEKYQKICETHFSSEREPINQASTELLFYQARLAEYEAEESVVHALAPHRHYSSSHGSSSQDHISKGNELVLKSAQTVVAFNEAAEAYRKLSNDIATDDITRFHEMMALWCDARSHEITIRATTTANQVRKLTSPYHHLITEAIQAYDAVITASSALLPKFSNNEDLETECNETNRYLQESQNRKKLLEAQDQQIKINSLISEKRDNTSTENNFSYHQNLLKQLEPFQAAIKAGSAEAPERLKSLWTSLSQYNITDLIKTTTESLKENISQLIQEAASQGQQAINVHKMVSAAHQKPSTIEASSSVESLLLLDDSPVAENLSAAATPLPATVSWSHVIRAAKTTREKYKTAVTATKSFPDLLDSTISINLLKNHRNYWDATCVSYLISQREAHANHWQQLSKEATGRTKTFLLQKASKRIDQAVSAHHLLQEAMENLRQDVPERGLAGMTEKECQQYKDALEAKQREINKALEESKKPSWTSWFCSFFKIPQWFYFWRTSSVA